MRALEGTREMHTGFAIACLAAVSVLPTAGVAVGNPVSALSTGEIPIADAARDLASSPNRARPVLFRSFGADAMELLIEGMLSEAARRQPRTGRPHGLSSESDRASDLAVSVDDAGLIRPAVYEVSPGETRLTSPTGSSPRDSGTRLGDRWSGVSVTIDPGALILDLGADGTIERRPNVAALVPAW